MKRIFIAIKLDPGQTLVRLLASLKSVLGGEKVNWTDPSNIHLTLAFLGDTPEEQVKMVSTVLKQACPGFGEFAFNLSGTGVFRNFSDPRVIWAGIEQCEQLIHLNDVIVNGLRHEGFQLEERRFQPHITLGRIKSISNIDSLRTALEKYNGLQIQKVEVKEVILFESILKPAGPVYIPTGIFSL